MWTPISRPVSSILGPALTCAFVLASASAAAQAVPGAPRGDWLAYHTETLSSGNLQRCGISSAVMAEWRNTLDAVAAVISTRPALADITGYVPRIASGVDSAAPIGSTDCKMAALAGYVALWPWLSKHVEPNPAASAAGPTFRLKRVWEYNGTGVLWISLNALPTFEGSPWEKDERGVFFEQPERQREVSGFPMYKNRIYITSRANSPLFVPVRQERVLKAYLAHARKEAPLTESFLASRKKAYGAFMSPASQERRQKEIEAAAASQKNPASSEQARKQAMAIDRRREEDYRKAANPAPDDPIFEPVKRLKTAEALQASMTDAERSAPAWRKWTPGGSKTPDMVPAGAQGARPVVEVNPAFFDFSAPRAALRNAVIRITEDQLSRRPGTSDLDMMESIERAVVFQTDWNLVAQLMK